MKTQPKKYIKYDENVRYDNLFMDFSGKYIFIKCNPDKFMDVYSISKEPIKKNDLLENNIEKHIH